MTNDSIDMGFFDLQLSDPKYLYNMLQDGFSCVISMHDGVVMYTTSSLTSTLGFPKDMWVGRSFIDFIHPRVRQFLAVFSIFYVNLTIVKTKYFCNRTVVSSLRR